MGRRIHNKETPLLPKRRRMERGRRSQRSSDHEPPPPRRNLPDEDDEGISTIDSSSDEGEGEVTQQVQVPEVPNQESSAGSADAPVPSTSSSLSLAPSSSSGTMLALPPPPPPSSASSPRTRTSNNSALTLPDQVQNLGWQESRRTLTSRALFLLNNPRMSDVTFLLGEEKDRVYGHKTLLAMGSPVFEAQFFGNFQEGGGDGNEVIELPDFDKDTFLLFLKYLYTDTLDREDMEEGRVINLLRPAKKYMVPHLIEKCSDILMKELKPENVFAIHACADFFDIPKLVGACLRCIDREAETIVQTEEFKVLSKETLAVFLRRGGLNISEAQLFYAVLRWADTECERINLENTDENIRTVLGNLLEIVRFPTMNASQFATQVATRNILTPVEKNSIFIYMCGGPESRSNPAFLPNFPVARRRFNPHQYSVNRFRDDPVPHSLNYRSGEIYDYRINVKADKQIYIKGVNIFCIRCGPQAQFVDQRRFTANVSIYNARTSTEELMKDPIGQATVVRDRALEPERTNPIPLSERGVPPPSIYCPVIFDREIRIPAGQMFSVSTIVSVACSSFHLPINTYLGKEERSEVEVNCADELTVNFTFTNAVGEAQVGKYTQGQIPELIFTL